jgi:hypothetical protein
MKILNAAAASPVTAYARVIANRLTLQIFRRALVGRRIICGPNLLGTLTESQFRPAANI